MVAVTWVLAGAGGAIALAAVVFWAVTLPRRTMDRLSPALRTFARHDVVEAQGERLVDLAARMQQIEQQFAALTFDQRQAQANTLAINDLSEAFKRLQGRFYQQRRRDPADELPTDPAALKNRLRAKAGLIPKAVNGEESD